MCAVPVVYIGGIHIFYFWEGCRKSNNSPDASPAGSMCRHLKHTLCVHPYLFLMVYSAKVFESTLCDVRNRYVNMDRCGMIHAEENRKI